MISRGMEPHGRETYRSDRLVNVTGGGRVVVVPLKGELVTGLDADRSGDLVSSLANHHVRSESFRGGVDGVVLVRGATNTGGTRGLAVDEHLLEGSMGSSELANGGESEECGGLHCC